MKRKERLERLDQKIKNIISEVYNYTIEQDPEKALCLLDCVSIYREIIDISPDKVIDKIESIIIYDLNQNHKKALLKMEVVKELISLTN